MAVTSRPRFRLLRYPALGLSAALFLVGSTLTGPAASFADEDSSTGGDSVGVTLTVASASPMLATDQKTLSVNVQVTNNTDAAVEAPTLNLYVDRDRVTTSEGLSSQINATPTASTSQLGTQVFNSKLDRISAGDSLEQTLTVPVSALGLRADEPGVYLLSGALSDRGETPVTRSALVWGNATADTQTTATLIIPVTLPSSLDALATAAQLSDLTSKTGTLSQLIPIAERTGGILAIDPRVLASIRILGKRAPQSAITWLDQLAALSNPSFELQFADADLAAQSQLGLTAPLAITSLSYADQDGTFLGTSDWATALPALTAWNYSMDDVVWPAAGSVVTEDLAFFQQSGRGTVILDSTNVADSATARTTPRATVEGLSALITDSGIADAVGDALAAKTTTDYSAATSLAAAELTLEAQQTGATPQHILLPLDRGAVADSTRITSTVNTLRSLSGLTLASLDSAAERSDSVTINNRPIDENRLTTLMTVLGNETAIDSFASVLVTPDLLASLQRSRVLHTFGAGLATGEDTFSARVRPALTRDSDTLNGVTITPTPLVLLGTESAIPVQVSNSLLFPVAVRVHAEASNNRLYIPASTEVTTIAPSSQVNIAVPVKATVSNGEVKIIMTLHNGADQPVGSPVTADVSLHGDWESIGIVILGGLVVLFFGFGAWRSVRNRRKQAHTASPTATESDSE
ncbi:hypothetical protein GCM10022198_19630 [Klugiella xanthotipulae]|uniref:Glycoprotein n=1 Tax=Klugiella xanthotipulae TaxID=244735 RepID=A0A543I6X0_9MICO|nr:DUF6049 family protein [Klugiella xanthotipulae]TQM66301.1 hypothetical protein FB466_1138 [Klugiella xanthotipulae]